MPVLVSFRPEVVKAIQLFPKKKQYELVSIHSLIKVMFLKGEMRRGKKTVDGKCWISSCKNKLFANGNIRSVSCEKESSFTIQSPEFKNY